MNEYQQALARGRARYGDKFSPPKVTPAQERYFRAERVEVTTTYPSGETCVRRGRIGITTGWAPCLLLIHRKNSFGSSDCLDHDDKITAVIVKGKRHPLCC